MKAWWSLALAMLAVCGCHERSVRSARSALDVVEGASRAELSAFESEAELSAFLRELRRASTRSLAANAKHSCTPETCQSLGADCGVHSDGCGGSIDCGPCTSAGEDSAEAPAAAPAEAAESVTNNQHAGVDEGGIVKLSGDFLIVLRRGRLFSVRIGSAALAPVSAIDAFGPGLDPSGSWYDELLVSGRTVVVIGYSYQRGGTEIGVFHLDALGRLSHRRTHQLRSNDYYSARNYASRLVGERLVFYTPLRLHVGDDDPWSSFPAIRRWPRDFTRTAAARNVYRPILATEALTLHTVTTCDLGEQDLGCSSTSVMGPPARVFYVSGESVYVWITDQRQGSLVYRLPLDGSSPSALRARRAGPVDQFSFLESDDGHLNVLLREDAAGDAMWGSERSAGDVALMRVPLGMFSDRVRRAPRRAYAALPTPHGESFQNRFVGQHVLYGTGSGWGAQRERRRGELYVHRFAGDGESVELALGHGVDRIEVLGKDAIAIGTDGEHLHFSPIALGRRPWAAPAFRRRDAGQGELRSHGFFYRPDGERTGILGLPIRESGRPGFEHLFEGSAAVLFVKNRGLALSELGTLAATPEPSADDGCRASCVDWYGNARPLFVQGRVFALLGYELVEGALRGGRLREVRRVSFSPLAH